MSASPARTTQRMTLRRFVRVTFDNFRELIQNIAAPTTSLPMPTLLPGSKQNGTVDDDSQPLPVEPTSMETDTIDGGTLETDITGEQPAGTEGAGHDEPGEESTSEPSHEPSLELAGEEEGILVPAGEVDNHAPGTVEAEHEVNTPEADTPQDTAPQDTAPQDTAMQETAAEEIIPEATLLEATASAETGDAESPVVVALPLTAALESLLFVSDEAVEPAQLARALGIAPGEVEAGLQALDAAYREGSRGLRLQTRNGRYQLVTAPEAANLIETFLNLDATSKLSAPALETLAVVAYRQPVTRAQIEAVRGVDCSGVLRSLLQRGLLEEVGRLDAPGRPVLYGVTDLFMHHFGLTALHELPPLESSELARIEDALEQQA
jgi:segregation and condensation protein B